LAFILPVLFVLLFGIIEFTRVLMVQHTLAEGVRLAAREASLPTVFSTSDVETTLRNHIRGSVPAAANASSTVNVTVTPSDLNGMTSGDPVSVSVTVNYSDVSWMPANGFRSVDGNTVLRAEATMERE
jgi:Flp pilus assembly protein TadG